MAYAEKRPGAKTWRSRYQRPDGTWGSEPGFPTRRAAERYGDDQEAAIRAGTWVDPKLGETKFADWWETWFPAQRLRRNSVKAYGQQYRKRIGPRWGAVPLAHIRGVDIQKWLKTLREDEGLSASTLNIITSALRGALEGAVFNQLIGRSPMPPKGQRDTEATPERAGQVVPLDAVARILANLRSDADRLMVLIALFTGMRWSEVAGMRTTDLHLTPAGDGVRASGYYRIDPQRGALHRGEHDRPTFGAPKSGSASVLAPGLKRGRIIDLPPFLVLMLLAYLATLPATKDDLLFPNTRGGPRRYETWNRDHWRPACDGRAASVSPTGRSVREALAPAYPGMWFHDLKHTCKGIMNDLRIHSAMQDYRLGHTSPGAPGVYSHPTPAMRAELVDALQGFFEAWVADLTAAWPGWRAPTSAPVSLPGPRPTAAVDNALF